VPVARLESGRAVLQVDGVNSNLTLG
jgi:hypothetical protein